MDLTTLFSKSLKHYRELTGFSQEELATKADLDRTFVSQLERGLKSPTLKSVQKLAKCLSIEPSFLLREPRGANGPRIPKDYLVRDLKRISILRDGKTIAIPASMMIAAVNVAHELIDDLYSTDLDIAAILGMRNLSAFIGELVASGISKSADGRLIPNPHQDGYPDLLLMDRVGKREWDSLLDRRNEKSPFSPFMGGGIEVKATCGSVPTPKQCRTRGIKRPGLGDTRAGCITGYDWKAHHRESNNLLGILWDFVNHRPRIVAMFYSSCLEHDDWTPIVKPRAGGGRTTSVSIMRRSGILKMYKGWLCVLSGGIYTSFLNKRNRADNIPARKP